MSTQQAVSIVLSNMPLILELISKDLINVASLARLITEKVASYTGKTPTNQAIVMAIHRYIENLDVSESIDIDVTAYLGNAEIKTGLFSASYANSDTLFNRLRQLIGMIKANDSVYLQFIKGSRATTIVSELERRDTVLGAFRNESLDMYSGDLAALIISLEHEPNDHARVISFLLNRFMYSGIEVVQHTGSFGEVVFLTSDNKISDAFSLYSELRRGEFVL